MRLQRDLREFIELLNSGSVEYAIVGAWAFGFYASLGLTAQDFRADVEEPGERPRRLLN